MKKKLPVGIEGFHDMRKEDFYYVDKTGFIRELLGSWGKVNLFTRPRRFGKTLNMDMLWAFLEIGADPELFCDLEIWKEKDLCEQYMGKFPVIFLSLKSVGGRTFETALENMSATIQEKARQMQFLLDSRQLTEIDKKPLYALFEDQISAGRQRSSLKLLSEMLAKHFGQKVILLIDEYDVPLDKAYENGYYDEMVEHIRGMLEMVLKTNDHLYFAVITGCLRISKESIFTGLNNFNVHTISDALYDEYFGFTDEEVRTLLADYGISEKYDEVRAWYDGYCFGREHVYCPWDVICYVKDHLSDTEAEAKAYWANSSSNGIVKDLIDGATGMVKKEIEDLIAGEVVEKEVIQELTYHDLSRKKGDESQSYLWSILYTTGYLTDAKAYRGGKHTLKIPNREVLHIFEQQIRSWFSKIIKDDMVKLKSFWEAVKNGNAEEMERHFNDYLRISISIRDTSVRKEKKENFYHGILLGLLSGEGNWMIKSNTESGDGYSDILIEIPAEKIGCLIEIKYAEYGAFDRGCIEAMNQIEEKRYTEKLQNDGMMTIYAYGVACYKKECRIICEDRST